MRIPFPCSKKYPAHTITIINNHQSPITNHHHDSKTKLQNAFSNTGFALFWKPWRSKTEQRMVFSIIHVKDSLLPMGKVWSLDFLGKHCSHQPPITNSQNMFRSSMVHWSKHAPPHLAADHLGFFRGRSKEQIEQLPGGFCYIPIKGSNNKKLHEKNPGFIVSS